MSDGVEWVIPLRLLRLLEHLAVLKTAILAWDGFPDIHGLKYMNVSTVKILLGEHESEEGEGSPFDAAFYFKRRNTFHQST